MVKLTLAFVYLSLLLVAKGAPVEGCWGCDMGRSSLSEELVLSLSYGVR